MEKNCEPATAFLNEEFYSDKTCFVIHDISPYFSTTGENNYLSRMFYKGILIACLNRVENILYVELPFEDNRTKANAAKKLVGLQNAHIEFVKGAIILNDEMWEGQRKSIKVN